MVWERSTWQCTRDVHDTAWSGVSLSNDRLIYRSSHGPMIIRHATTGEVVHEIPLPETDIDISFCRVVGCTRSGAVIVFQRGFVPHGAGRVRHCRRCYILEETAASGWASHTVELGPTRDVPAVWADTLLYYGGIGKLELVDLVTLEEAAVQLNSDGHRFCNTTAYGQRLVVLSSKEGSNGRDKYFFTLYTAA